jgi:nucleoside-diphosphate-sugar epimerase
MKVALLGATGFVGSALLKEALDRGHVVTVIVRRPEKLEKRGDLTAKAGDVYDTASIATLIRGKEACALETIAEAVLVLQCRDLTFTKWDSSDAVPQSSRFRAKVPRPIRRGPC